MYIFIIHIRFNLTMDPAFSFTTYGNPKQEELQMLSENELITYYEDQHSPFDVFIFLLASSQIFSKRQSLLFILGKDHPPIHTYF